MDFKVKYKHYWIFLVTIIFYCIGIAIHFIAQHQGARPHKGKEILEKVNPITNIINESKLSKNNRTTEEGDDTKYTSPDNLFYFMQISDIHMSDKYSKGAQGNLFYFLKKMIPVIDPNFLFITGDITDSVNGSGVGTVEDDWKMYHKIIENTGVLNKNNGTFLWDLRGNHDCFMVPEWNSPYNYFKDYSKVKTRGFAFNYETSYGTYSFIGLDGCPIYSTSNPFFGVTDEIIMDMYTDFMDKAKANNNNKHNFVLNHFPETTIKFSESSSGKRWEDYTKDISLLLTGHFHNFGGLQTYAYHKDYLELEVTDFKLHGRYRILAVDNDVVSFTDYFLPLPSNPYDFKTTNIDNLINNPPEVFNQSLPPIVHITSPKDSRFILKTHEPIKESFASNYIRVLVFSEQSPSDLKLSLYIDNKIQETEFKYVGDQKIGKRSLQKVNIYSREEKDNVNTSNENEKQTIESNTPPLWIAKWDSSKYNDGKSHELKVVVEDNKNLKGDNTIKFRLDGKSDDFGITFMGRIVLKTSFMTTLPIFFGIVYIIYELMIILPRLYAIKHIIPKHNDLPFLPNRYIGDMISEETKSFQTGFFKRHFILPFIEAFTFNGIFYPLQILMICLVVLPGKVGFLSRSSENVSKLGGEFLYGMYGSGQWSNVHDQYGVYILLLIIIPIVDTLVIVFSNHKRKRHHIINLILLVIMCLIQVVLSFGVSYISGGVLAIFLSPFPTWICFYCWFLIIIIVIRRLKEHYSKSIASETAALA